MHSHFDLEGPPAQEISRRTLLRAGLAATGGIAASTLLAACSSAASKSSTTTTKATTTTTTTAAEAMRSLNVQLVWLKNVQFGGSFLAAQHGFYRQSNVSPNLVAGGPSVSVEPLVLAGKALVGVSNPDTTAAAIAQGAKLKVVASTYQRSPFSIASPATKPLKTPQDLIGKKIGVAQTSLPIFNTFLKANAIDARKITVVPVQFDPTPLAKGQVDGLLSFVTDEPVTLQLAGFNTYQLKFADYGYKLYGDCYIVTDSTLADPVKRATVTSFLTAERRGWQLAASDPAAAAAAAMTVSGRALKLELKQQTLESQAQVQLIRPAGDAASDVLLLKDEDMAANIKTLALGGSKITQSQLFDSSISQKLRTS